MKMKLFLVAVSVSLLSTSLTYAGSVNITESEYKKEWPLTVAGGTLNCTPLLVGNWNLGIVTFISDGKTYAINGTARGRAEKNGWREIDEILNNDPKKPGMKMDINPFIKRGLSLCNADKSLGMQPEEFRQSFNSIVGKINTDWKLAEFDIEKGEVNDTFKRTLSKDIGIIGSVNKTDGSLREIMVIVSGSADSAESLKAISVILAASQSVNTSIPKEENSKTVFDMVQTALKNIKTGKPIEKTLGNLKYTSSAIESINCLMFAISKP